MDEVDEIKQRLDVAEVVGSYLPLKQAGRNLKASCPFHQEKSASFMVSPEKGIWHCFGCGEGGDIFKFVMKMEGLDFRGALEKLAQQAGVELKNRGDGKTAEAKKRMTAANQLAVRYFQQSLIKNPRALEYIIKKRKLAKQTVQDFQLGFAPESWEGLVGILRKQGFTDDEMVRAGLASSKGRGAFDLFRGRIMFTICDGQGQPVGFTGRVLDDSEPKYLNTPQTLLYDKSRAIYGLHLAKEAMRVSDEAVIVEGNMDVVASHQAGVKQVVASSGTALTLDQLRSLGRLTKNIKLAFDQDAAGLKATERVIELAVKLGLQLKVVELTNAKDPDELISRSVDEWKKAIKDAAYVIDYLFDRFAREYDLTSATGKRQYTDRLAATLNRLSDPVERDHYIRRLAEAVGVSHEAVSLKVERAEPTEMSNAKIPMPKEVSSSNDSNGKPAKPSARQIQEEQLLALVLAFPATAPALDDLTQASFSTPERQEIFRGIRHQASGSSQKTKAGAYPLVPSASTMQSDYVKILTLRGEEQYDSLDPADRSFEAFELTKRLQTLSSKQSKQELTRQIQAAETSGDDTLRDQLMQQYQALMKE